MFSGGIALFSLGLHLYYYRPDGPSLLPPVFVLVIQTITFLLVGYYISVLVRQLRQQNESLAQANARLADHAATLEELTISRERNRMARELHDTLAHTLSALSVQLETAQSLPGRGSERDGGHSGDLAGGHSLRPARDAPGAQVAARQPAGGYGVGAGAADAGRGNRGTRQPGAAASWCRPTCPLCPTRSSSVSTG